MNIELHVERLILDGFSLTPRERAVLSAAFEGELRRLLSEGGLTPVLAEGGAAPLLRGNSIAVTAGMTPSQLGVQIAQSVYSGMSKPS